MAEPLNTPPSKKSTRLTPMLSEVVVLISTVWATEYVLPDAGLLMETVGGVRSGPVVAVATLLGGESPVEL